MVVDDKRKKLFSIGMVLFIVMSITAAHAFSIEFRRVTKLLGTSKGRSVLANFSELWVPVEGWLLAHPM